MLNVSQSLDTIISKNSHARMNNKPGVPSETTCETISLPVTNRLIDDIIRFYK